MKIKPNRLTQTNINARKREESSDVESKTRVDCITFDLFNLNRNYVSRQDPVICFNHFKGMFV